MLDVTVKIKYNGISDKYITAVMFSIISTEESLLAWKTSGGRNRCSDCESLPLNALDKQGEVKTHHHHQTMLVTDGNSWAQKNQQQHTHAHASVHPHLLCSSSQPAGNHRPFKTQKLPQKKENKAGACKCFAVFVSLSFPPSVSVSGPGGGHLVVATVTRLPFKEDNNQSAT